MGGDLGLQDSLIRSLCDCLINLRPQLMTKGVTFEGLYSLWALEKSEVHCPIRSLCLLC